MVELPDHTLAKPVQLDVLQDRTPERRLATRAAMSTRHGPLPGDVHIWTVPLDLPETEITPLLHLLSDGELERSRRFRFDLHRNRYLSAHGWLRRVLASYLEIPAGDLEFQFGPRGKPGIAPGLGSQSIQFNLAHSEGLALIGVTQLVQVGVDLERVRALDDASDLVRRFFSQRESRAFQLLPESQKPIAFFNLWTRKEAWLKATGEGITHLLDKVEVSFLPGQPAQLLNLPAPYCSDATWCLHELQVKPGFAAAVAVAAPEIRAELHQIDELMGVDL